MKYQILGKKHVRHKHEYTDGVDNVEHVLGLHNLSS